MSVVHFLTEDNQTELFLYDDDLDVIPCVELLDIPGRIMMANVLLNLYRMEMKVESNG